MRLVPITLILGTVICCPRLPRKLHITTLKVGRYGWGTAVASKVSRESRFVAVKPHCQRDFGYRPLTTNATTKVV